MGPPRWGVALARVLIGYGALAHRLRNARNAYRRRAHH